MNMGYPVVSKLDPFLVIQVRGVLLSDIQTVGTTSLRVERVGENVAAAEYAPIEIKGNKLTFALDDTVFNKLGGRYLGFLTYRGTPLETIRFIYEKPKVELVGE